LTRCKLFYVIFQDEIEVEGKLLRAGKSVGVVSVDFRKKKTGRLMAQARHTKYLAVSSKL
jgi:acyl-coenzyme A thioesterase 13